MYFLFHFRASSTEYVPLKDIHVDKDASMNRKDSARSLPKMRASLYTVNEGSGTEITAPPKDSSVSIETIIKGMIPMEVITTVHLDSNLLLIQIGQKTIDPSHYHLLLPKLIEFLLLPKDDVHKNQYSFCEGQSTLMASSFLQDVISYSKQQGTLLHVSSLDAEKCFNRIRYI